MRPFIVIYRKPHLQKAAAAGLRWPLPEDLDERRLEELFWSAPAGRPRRSFRPLPDFAEVRRQLQAHKHLTLQLVWENTGKSATSA